MGKRTRFKLIFPRFCAETKESQVKSSIWKSDDTRKLLHFEK